MRKVLIAATMVALAVAVAFPASATPRNTRFVPLGAEPGAMFPLSQAFGISGDGEVIVGCLGFLGCGVFRWEDDGNGYKIAYASNQAPEISDNYDILMTPSSLNAAAFWIGGEFPDPIFSDPIPSAPGFAPCGSSGQSAFGLSSDGQHATGLTWIDEDEDGSGCEGASAYVWDRATNTTTVLSNAVNNDSTRGNALNADGRVVVGWGQTNQREAMKWVDGVQSFICDDALGAGGDVFCSEGWDVSADGQKILTSYAGPMDFSSTAAIIDGAGNVTKMDKPAFPGDPQFDTWNARGLRSDGGAVVGSYGGSGFFGSPPYPVLWTPEIGTIDLQVMLLGQGLDDLFFWFLSEAFDISDDGTKIVGRGTNPDGWVEAYMIDIGKVKVCHKPESGNPRTISVAWDSIGAHMGHGDDLSTCEFANADGRSRAAERLLRGVAVDTSAATDKRMLTPEQMRQLEAMGANSYGPAAGTADGRPSYGTQLTSEERVRRTKHLADRVTDGAIRH